MSLLIRAVNQSAYSVPIESWGGTLSRFGDRLGCHWATLAIDLLI